MCASCHGLSLASFRELEHIGYTEAEVKKIASDWKIQVPTINPDTGEAMTRKALPSDTFPEPFANPQAARASNNNAYPPDLTLITKAREGGAPYIYSLLTGYRNAKTYRNSHGEAVPADAQPAQNLHFNPYFANLNIAMPPPLTAEGQVTYADGHPTARSTRWPRTSAPSWCGPRSPSSSGAAPPAWRSPSSSCSRPFSAISPTARSGPRRSGQCARRGRWSPTNQAKSRRAKRDAGIEG